MSARTDRAVGVTGTKEDNSTIVDSPAYDVVSAALGKLGNLCVEKLRGSITEPFGTPHHCLRSPEVKFLKRQ